MLRTTTMTETNLTVEQIADAHNVTPQTVRRWATKTQHHAPCPHSKDGRGRLRFDPQAVAKWLSTTGVLERSKAQTNSTFDIDDDELRAEMIRKTKSAADLNEIKAAREMRQLLPASEVTRAWSRVAMRVRAQVLAVPDSAGPAMDGMNARERIREMRERLEEALEQLDAEQEPTTAHDNPEATDGH